MSHIDSHAPGSFSWIELATSNQEAAKAFYAKVFGWNFEDSPMAPGEFYTMFKLEDRYLGATFSQQPAEKAMGIPAHWNLYIDVKSADETAKRATVLGATILAGPFDASTYGRMAIIKDPQGAVFSIWEPKDHDGFGIHDQHGTFCWADVNIPDQQAAVKFYGELFGWTFEPGNSGYLHIRNGETPIGGMPSAQQLPKGIPPHWMIYLQVDDCDATAIKLQESGGHVHMGPITLENVGRFAVAADPQDAAFALFTPAPRG